MTHFVETIIPTNTENLKTEKMHMRLFLVLLDVIKHD